MSVRAAALQTDLKQGGQGVGRRQGQEEPEVEGTERVSLPVEGAWSKVGQGV